MLGGSYTVLPQTHPNASGASSSVRPPAGASSLALWVVMAIGTRHIVVVAAIHTAATSFTVLIASLNRRSKCLLVRWTRLAAHSALKPTYI